MSCQNDTCAVEVGKVYAVLSENDSAKNDFEGKVVRVGKNFINVNPTSVTEIVSPETNTNGVIIRTASCASWNGWLNVYVGTSAPSGAADTSKAIIFGNHGNEQVGTNSVTFMPNPLYVSPGEGIWAANSGVGELAMTWDVL